MDLPPGLRDAIDAALDGISAVELARATSLLTARYREEVRDGREHLADDAAARAYIAVRLPATFAAIDAAMNAAAEMWPQFAPRTMLDLGAGPGSAVWAAFQRWPSLEEAVLVERAAPIRRLGEEFALRGRSAGGLPASLVWRDDDLTSGLAGYSEADLVSLAYVLDELAPETRDGLIDRLWGLTREVLLIVEPGTPAGWRRILSARDRLIAAGAHLLAPCPHAAACAVSAPDWCHFSRRLGRSRLHRRAKLAALPWEDEKYIYLAASRQKGEAFLARVLAPPRTASGQVSLKLCGRDGTIGNRRLTRRDGATFKRARRLDWGDAVLG